MPTAHPASYFTKHSNNSSSNFSDNDFLSTINFYFLFILSKVLHFKNINFSFKSDLSNIYTWVQTALPFHAVRNHFFMPLQYLKFSFNCITEPSWHTFTLCRTMYTKGETKREGNKQDAAALVLTFKTENKFINNILYHHQNHWVWWSSC